LKTIIYARHPVRLSLIWRLGSLRSGLIRGVVGLCGVQGAVFERLQFSSGLGCAVGLVHRILRLARLMEGQASACGNQAADDDVLLQATQCVALAHDGGFGQHARGFLEGRGGDEAVGGQAGLGDAQQQVVEGGGHLAVAQERSLRARTWERSACSPAM